MKKLQHNLRELRSFFRFGIVGCSNTLVDFGVFTILQAVFDVNYLWCQVLGYSAGVLNSFVLNKVWTFESKTSHIQTSRQLGKFIVINIVSLSVSLVGLKLLIGNWNMNVYIAKALLTLVAQIVNYSGYRFWVFSDKRQLCTKNSLS